MSKIVLKPIVLPLLSTLPKPKSSSIDVRFLLKRQVT